MDKIRNVIILKSLMYKKIVQSSLNPPPSVYILPYTSSTNLIPVLTIQKINSRLTIHLRPHNTEFNLEKKQMGDWISRGTQPSQSPLSHANEKKQTCPIRVSGEFVVITFFFLPSVVTSCSVCPSIFHVIQLNQFIDVQEYIFYISGVLVS